MRHDHHSFRRNRAAFPAARPEPGYNLKIKPKLPYGKGINHILIKIPGADSPATPSSRPPAPAWGRIFDAKLRLATDIVHYIIRARAKQSLAKKPVPELELGNQKKPGHF
jgi:hypothetical protein